MIHPASTSKSVEREELHSRRLDMRGFRRSDGLYEVEGRLVDRKPYAFKAPGGERSVPARGAIHDLGVCLVFGEDMVVCGVRTVAEAVPYEPCWEAGQTLQGMVGAHIGKGWNREVRTRLSGAQSCTHLMELLVPLATVAYQTLTTFRMERPEALDASGRPLKIDSCYAYAQHREIVLKRWPAYHATPPQE